MIDGALLGVGANGELFTKQTLTAPWAALGKGPGQGDHPGGGRRQPLNEEDPAVRVGGARLLRQDEKRMSSELTHSTHSR